MIVAAGFTRGADAGRDEGNVRWELGAEQGNFERGANEATEAGGGGEGTEAGDLGVGSDGDAELGEAGRVH